MVELQSTYITNDIRNRIMNVDNTDKEAVMDICIQHAHDVVQEVWSGGTVDPDTLQWKWNNRLRSSAGRYCTHPPTIELAWEYFEKHNWNELLSIVRHELIHAWQHKHPDCNNIGHGPKFKQWLDDLETEKHCKYW